MMTHEDDIPVPDIDARDGDILVVAYPEVAYPIAAYGVNVKIGGLIYTRKLRAGDDVSEQYDRIYAFLKAKAERDGREKVKKFSDALRSKETR